MPISKEFLDAVAMAAVRTSGPLRIPWPMPGNPGAFHSFATFTEWRDFVLRLSLNQVVPKAVSSQFERAQKLQILAWIDADLIKAGELVAVAALELALRDRYGTMIKDRRKGKNRKGNDNPPFAELLRHMPQCDELTDERLPMIQRCGGSVVGFLTGECKPSLAEVRNGLAHGDPFNSLPWAGLLELIKDLIEYAYRGMIAESRQGPTL